MQNWLWWWAPTGPSFPFGPFPLWAFDTLRLLCVLAAAFVVLAGGWAAWRCHNESQRVRFLALIILALGVLGTELGHLGDDAHYRLVLSVLGVGLAVAGVVGYFRRERPADPAGHDHPR